MGRDKNYDGRGFDSGCFKVYGLNHGESSVTKKTCQDQGHFLGNLSNPIFTVIDTPGFGNNLVSTIFGVSINEIAPKALVYNSIFDSC
jgi:hypothetical protein